jgi:hypothetical protein
VVRIDVGIVEAKESIRSGENSYKALLSGPQTSSSYDPLSLVFPPEAPVVFAGVMVGP